jgi:uncharacterized surface protein with fasciclin (FAS1) repeats
LVKPVEQDLIATARANGQLNQLLGAAEKVQLLEEIGEGPYTIFAPTDAAFGKLDEALASRIQADEAVLRDVLLYHAVIGKLMSGDLVQKKSVVSVAGADLRIEKRPEGVFVNGARVEKSDIVCTDGVLHVIDSVLVPPGLPPAKESESPDSSGN